MGNTKIFSKKHNVLVTSIGLKISLILVISFIGNSNATVAYATNQKPETSIENKSPKQLNDPTMPKIAPPIEEPSDLKATKPIVEEKPTTPNPVIQAGKLKLSIILIRNNDKTAVINEQTVREKDKISGYEVAKIERNKVILKNPKTKQEHKKSKKPTLPGEPEKPEPIEPDTFTELKLPTVTIKSFFASPSTISSQPSAEKLPSKK